MGRPKLASDEQILQAAALVFLEQGASASIAAVAERVGLSEAAIFKRFGSKQALLQRALASEEDLSWLDPLSAEPMDDPREALVAFAIELVAQFRQIIPRTLTLRTHTPTLELLRREGAPPPLRVREALVRFLKRERRAGRVGPCDVTTVAQMLIGAVHSFVFFELLADEPASDDERERAARKYVKDVVTQLWAGISPRERGADR